MAMFLQAQYKLENYDLPQLSGMRQDHYLPAHQDKSEFLSLISS